MRKAPSLLLLLAASLLSACSPDIPATDATTPIAEQTEEPNAVSTNTPIPTPDPNLTADNPQPGAEGIGDPYFPQFGNGGYDALHYVLDLDVDMQQDSIAGTVTISALATQDLSSFNLDFIGFDIQEVRVNNEAATYTRDGGELAITPAQAIAEGAHFQVAVSYAGVPGEDLPEDVADYSVGWSNYGSGILVAGEPSGSAAWYPVNEHPLDKATYAFEITVAEPFEVAANGMLIEVIEEGGERTFIWESRDPIAPYLVTVGIAEFDVETQEGPNGLPIRNYFGEGVPQGARDNFARTPEMIAYFSEIFGPYPFETYGVVVHDLELRFALETQTLSVFGRSFNNETVVTHELAHSWFGNSVCLESWQDIWLNEGFATYASVLWAEHAYGEIAAEEELRGQYEVMAAGTPHEQLRTSELITFFHQFSLRGEDLSAEETTEALNILLEGIVSRDEIAQVVADSGRETFDMRDITDLIDELDFDRLAISYWRIDQFLIAIGLEEEAFGVPEFYPLTGDPTPEGMFSGSVYSRGSLTLHALRLEVGDETFFEILRTYASRYMNSNASTADFIAVAEEISGQELDAFFDAWLYQTTIPDMPEMGLFREDYLLPDSQ